MIDRYQRVLFNVSLRMVGNREDAKDITQTVFLKAYQAMGTFDRRHKFFSWIYRIMINETLNHLSKRKRTEPLDESFRSDESGPEEDCSRTRLRDDCPRPDRTLAHVFSAPPRLPPSGPTRKR